MPQLDPTWFASQLFWLAVTFTVLYFVLSKLVLPPLQDVMARRQSTVAGDIAQAQSLKTQADQAKVEYERTLAEARSRAQATVASTLAEHKAKAEADSRNMDRQIEQRLTDASRKIAQQKQELLDALTPTAAELTSLIVEKLTQQKPSGDQVSRTLNELSKGRR